MRNNNYHSKRKTAPNKASSKTMPKEQKKLNYKTIYDLYKTNFKDNCELILLEKESIFLDKFFNKMKLIIKTEFGEDIFDKNKTVYQMTKKCENNFISDVYWPMYDSCLSGLEKIKSSRNKTNNALFISNFMSHCNFEQIALHSCGSKYIQINSSKNSNIYIACLNCKKCYFNESFPVYCPFNHKTYYSKIIAEDEKSYEPATWSEYHCKNPIINEQMSCIRCGDKFWIKKNKLFCKNCKFEVDPLLILWTCTICKKEFRSKVKKYNPLEYKDVENAIREAFLYKKIAKPKEVPCKCIKSNDIKNFNFCHKANGLCKGILYCSKLKDEDILVCSLCNCIFSLNKFYWNCPICSRKFISKEITASYKDNLDMDMKSNSKNKSYKFKNNINLNPGNKSDNLDKDLLYLSCKGTPLRNENNYNLKNNNMSSYVKKKPNDHYNHSVKSKDENKNNSIYKSKRRNLSINITNKAITNNSYIGNNKDIKNLNDKNSVENIEKDNKYNTNNNFYLKNNLLKDISKASKDNILNYTNNNNDHSIYDNNNNNIINNSNNNNNSNEYFSPIKKENASEKKQTKIQLNTNIPRQYNGLNDSRRYASTSTRNYNYNNIENDEISNTDYRIEKNLNTSIKPKKYEKYFINNNESRNVQIYIPKKKIDLNKSNNMISSPLNIDNKITDFNGNNNAKLSISNSVGMRERYKKINTKINNIYEKRNLKTMQDENNDDEDKRFIEIQRPSSRINYTKTINEDYKDIRSSSQIKIDKEKYKNINLDMTNFKNNIRNHIRDESLSVKNKASDNYINLKHKYNKRYIANKNNFNFTNITINTTSSNIYKKATNSAYNKEKTGTNKSNGGDNITVNNFITNNDENLDKMYKNSKNKNNELSHTNRRDKKNILYKDKDDKDYKDSSKFISIQDNDDINNDSIRNSFINGGNSVKEVETPKKSKSFVNEDKNSDNDELKEFNFNDYKIITQLGQGTFGKIYLVQDKNNELFSMKKIILSEELDVQTVINEYKMCQKLKHPNVVKILGIYNNKLDRTTYVVYVLMEVGLTDWEKEIRSYNDKNLEYTEKELILIIKQLSSVLSFLQRNNISHRDIKPQNILVFKNSIYKVADFGEAKQIDNITKNLINNSLRGTELYMSPLLFNGLRTGQIDIKHNLFKSDVYSLGLCVLYAAMTSNKPLYEIRKYVDMAGVKKYLDKLLKGKYSQKFMNLLISMIEIHEKNRPDFIELEKIMKKWKV